VGEDDFLVFVVNNTGFYTSTSERTKRGRGNMRQIMGLSKAHGDKQ